MCRQETLSKTNRLYDRTFQCNNFYLHVVTVKFFQGFGYQDSSILYLIDSINMKKFACSLHLTVELQCKFQQYVICSLAPNRSLTEKVEANSTKGNFH